MLRSQCLSMLETDQPVSAHARSAWLGSLSRSISAKLMVSIFIAMLYIFALLGYFSIRLHRKHLEAAALVSAEQQSEVLRRSASHYMLNNDRDGLYEMMANMADQPGIVRVRIMNSEGVISYSTLPSEVGGAVNKDAEACYGCHEQSKPLALLKRSDRFRVYRNDGIARTGHHHSHRESAGLLERRLPRASRGAADSRRARHQSFSGKSRRAGGGEQPPMLAYTGCALLLIALLSWFFIWQVVGRPLKALERGTERLAAGDLGYQIPVQSNDEIGELAELHSMDMSRQLQTEHKPRTFPGPARSKSASSEKTRELKRAHEQRCTPRRWRPSARWPPCWRMRSTIRSRASSLTQAGEMDGSEKFLAIRGRNRRRGDCDSLDLIASESRRCGDLVKNLLTFSRVTPMNLQPANLNQVVERSLRLVQHKMDMAGIQAQSQVGRRTTAGAAATRTRSSRSARLVINASTPCRKAAICGSPRARYRPAIELTIRDDGMGIPPKILPHIFEPFSHQRKGPAVRAWPGHQPKHCGAPQRKHRRTFRSWGSGTTFTDSAWTG